MTLPSVTRPVLAPLVVALASSAAMPAQAAPADGCVARPIPTDSQVVTCALEPSKLGVPMRFVATFGGSHDDTRLLLEAKLDGRPLDCDAGSTTSLFAEDGIVRLDCRFRVAAPNGRPATPMQLEVALTVHHAQYIASSLDPQ